MLSVVCHKPFLDQVQEVHLSYTLPSFHASRRLCVCVPPLFLSLLGRTLLSQGTNCCVDLPNPRLSLPITSLPLHLPTHLPKPNISSRLAYYYTCLGEDEGL